MPLIHLIGLLYLHQLERQLVVVVVVVVSVEQTHNLM
jgi:hypothetical protein